MEKAVVKVTISVKVYLLGALFRLFGGRKYRKIFKKVPRDFLKCSERLFLSPRTLQDYRDKNIIPYTQIAGKILYRLSDINRILSENYRKRVNL